MKTKISKGATFTGSKGHKSDKDCKKDKFFTMMLTFDLGICF